MGGVVAVIQARMGSTRLPGKVLRPIAGKPIIWHIIHRLQLCERIDQIVIATTIEASDDPLAEYAKTLNIPVLRGDVEDVLGRFIMAADAFDPSIIVRVNGDAPLIDPIFVDGLIDELRHHDADFVMLKPGVTCIHDGVDPFSRRALDMMASEAREDPIAREHVTGYLKSNPDKIRVRYIDVGNEYKLEGARLSVDTPADLTFFEKLHEVLGADAGSLYLPEVTRLLRSDPSLAAINAHVQQKAMTHVGRTAIIRCDGGGTIGFGHVTRCLAVATNLRDTYGFAIVFAMIDGEGRAAAIERVRGAAFKVDVLKQDSDEAEWIRTLCQDLLPTVFFCDVRTDLLGETLDQIRDLNSVVVLYDDGTERRLSADLAIYPPVPQLDTMDWSGSRADVKSGWQYVILSPDVMAAKMALSTEQAVKLIERALVDDDDRALRVLVSMGGSDPYHLTLPIAEQINQYDGDRDLEVSFVVGPAVRDAQGIAQQIEDMNSYFEAHVAPDGLGELIAKVDCGIISYGVSAFEMAHFGVPALLLCLDEDHARSAEIFTDSGAAHVCALTDEKLPDDFMVRIRDLVNADNGRREMGLRAQSLVDGAGAQRVTDLIVEKIDQRSDEVSEKQLA